MADYTEKFHARVEAMSALMWNEARGCWFDLDTEGRCQREMFLLSNLTPLFTGCLEEADRPHLATLVVNYLQVIFHFFLSKIIVFIDQISNWLYT